MRKINWESSVPWIGMAVILVVILAFMVCCVQLDHRGFSPLWLKGKAEVIKIEPDYAMVSEGFVKEFWKLTGKTELYLNYLIVQYENGTFKVKKRMLERYDELKRR